MKKTMLDCLSSTKELFEAERRKLKSMFFKLKYPKDLVDFIVSAIFKSRLSGEPSSPVQYTNNHQYASSYHSRTQSQQTCYEKQLDSLGNKIGMSLQPVYLNAKLRDVLSVKEPKPTVVVNQQGVVYRFKCLLCDSEYIGFTTRHLFQRIEEHCHNSSSICRHILTSHDPSPKSIIQAENFKVQKKCQGKMD